MAIPWLVIRINSSSPDKIGASREVLIASIFRKLGFSDWH